MSDYGIKENPTMKAGLPTDRTKGHESALRPSSLAENGRLFAITDTLESDEWYTPRYIFDALGLEFDLDPCAPPGGVPWIPAKKVYTAEEDGLSQAWRGNVWLNPPYSQPWPWLDRLAMHGFGIALVPADTANRGFQRSGPSASIACFLRDRVTFVKLDSENKTSARFPSVLLAWGQLNRKALIDSDLGWCVRGVPRS